MAELHWLETMSVGITAFDDAHKGYIVALKAIAAALEQDDPVKAERLCAAFLDAAVEHGRQELAFLRRKGFPRIQTIIDTQSDTQVKIGALADAIRLDRQTARRMVEEMRLAVVNYLLRGDINFKSFVQHLADRGVSIDPFAPEGE